MGKQTAQAKEVYTQGSCYCLQKQLSAYIINNSACIINVGVIRKFFPKGYLHKSFVRGHLICGIVPVYWMKSVDYKATKTEIIREAFWCYRSNAYRNKLSFQATTSNGICHFACKATWSCNVIRINCRAPRRYKVK